MQVPFNGAIDCDLHPALPPTAALLPYLPDYWRDQFANRHIDRYTLQPDQLSAELAAQRAAGLARGERRAGRRSRPAAARGARPRSARACDLQSAARRDRAVQRGHGGGAVRRRERLGRERAARPRAAAARLDPGADARSAAPPSPRSSASPGDRRFVQVLLPVMGDLMLGAPPLLAGLRGGREARAADRHPRRQHLSARADARRAGRPTRSRTTSRNPRRSRTSWSSFVTEGVFQQVPQAQAGADRIRLHLAAAAALAHQQAVARRAAGGSLDRPVAGRDHPRARAADLAADRCAGRRSEAARAHPRSHRFRRDAAVLDRLSRTGSSTATMSCPTACRTQPCAGSWSTIRSRPIRVCAKRLKSSDNAATHKETVR